MIISNEVSSAHLAVKVKQMAYDENRKFFSKSETNESVGMSKSEWQEYLDGLNAIYNTKMQFRMDNFTIITPRKSSDILLEIKRVTRILNN